MIPSTSTSTSSTTSTTTDTTGPVAAAADSGPRPPRWRRAIRRGLRWLRNGSLAIVVILLAAAAVGQLQQARLQRAHPASGELIDVGGHRLHVIRSGGGPTIVLENGPGGMALDWTLVKNELADEVTTVAYDRAGTGWSEVGPRPRDVATLVEELHTALAASGSPAPYVLVGHSFGGLIVRAYAYTYPDEVAGLVLVDAAHEDQFDIYPAAYAAKADNLATAMGRLRGVYRAVTGSGIPALFANSFPDPVADRLPAEVATARRAVTLMDSSHATTATDEMVALADSLDHVRRIRRPLGDLPVVVIRHGRPIGEEAGVPAGLEEQVEAAWRRMQDDLATISTDSRLVVAEDSGHDIHLERPELVTDAILDVVGRATD
jgi:pimeloyl-ACP methyl ester carboxylesterase